ncbi:hypothetical protein [Enterococcus thailandicus]|uniref:hypothetical protein n=1 Tax=Enterococcus thailandicus TaxID=417368 RepID=UPI0035D777C6
MEKFYFPYDAMSSWAGYDIQGKMTVYFILNEIYKAIEKNKKCNFEDLKEELSQIFVELENLEDIAILERNEYRQIYQVKAGKNTKLKSADCYNLYVASYMLKMMFSQDKLNDTNKNEDSGVYLISTHNLDNADQIKELGRKHLENLLNTNYESDISKDKIEDINGRAKKASFQSLIRKMGIMDFPKSVRKQKVQSDIIAPLNSLLESWDDLNVNIYSSEHISDSDAIKDTCLQIIEKIKGIILDKHPDSIELSQLVEKENENIYWNLVDLLDLELFFTKIEDEKNQENPKIEKKRGVQISVSDFLDNMCNPIDNSIDEIVLLSHILSDKLHQVLNEIPLYFREEEIINCPEESESCSSCTMNENCLFMRKLKVIFDKRGSVLLDFFSRLFLNENGDLRNSNNLPQDDDILAVFYKNIGRYENFNYADGIPEALIAIEPAKKMIAEMSTVDNATIIARKISRIGTKDIKFIEKLFESSYLFHMHGEESFSPFHYGNNEKFTDIVCEDLTSDEMSKLKFMSRDVTYDFTGPAIVKVIGTKEAEVLLNAESST